MKAEVKICPKHGTPKEEDSFGGGWTQMICTKCRDEYESPEAVNKRQREKSARRKIVKAQARARAARELAGIEKR